ncbi:MAG TPA: YCF48-related protein [Pirellulales bacterium]|nr:YCF48-related protein [Pirellulales bacterium]
MQEDAELTDVTFADAQRGWAVGDRGAIWNTIDGGQHWRLQPSGVACRLTSVQFLDAENGWAAGGRFHPYTHTSRGVLLRTRDGGRSWAQDKGLMLPGLRQIKFFTGSIGWAFGEASALFPSAVFGTENGARTWGPLAGVSSPGWRAGDFIDGHTGALADHFGKLATVRRHGLQAARTPPTGLRRLNRMKLVSPTRGWLVGDGGLVLTTSDLGASWQLPEGDVAGVASADFDWHALAVRGERVWIAGTPGTKVLTSEDNGRTWQAFATGQHLPIHAISFADNLHGWAVGALGAILSTHDGGRTWQRQRTGGTRAALLAIYSQPKLVPLEALARLSANDGYLAAVEIIHRPDEQPGDSDLQTLCERARAAMIDAGASAAQTAWQFPLPPTDAAPNVERMIEAWDRANDGKGLERLKAHLVRQIRCWRPDLVVTHAASPHGDDPLGHVINQIVLECVEQAADATCYPELAEMGLEPWRVRKVLGSLPAGQLGDVNLTTAQLASRLGYSLADHVAGPRGLIADRYQASPVNLGFRRYVDKLPQRAGEHDFFSGIVLHPGGEARRMLAEFSSQGVDVMRRIAQKHRNMQAVITRSEQSDFDASRFLAQVGDLTSGLDDATAGNVVYQLAESFRHAGRWPLAAETFGVLADRYPDHPLTEAALVWLVHYWSSGEAAWRVARDSRVKGQRTAAAQLAGQMSLFPATGTLGQVLPANGQAEGGRPVGHGHVFTLDNTLEHNWPERASALGKVLEQRSPATFAEPTVRFPLAAAHRKQGLPRQAERYYLETARSRGKDAWWACAAGERWLNDPQDLPPKAILRAASGPKPRLDGALTDDLWKRAHRVALHAQAAGDAEGELAASALIGYDSEFLYLAAECQKAPSEKYAHADGPRPRDADLSAQDRVDFYVDLDRDWSTYFRLSIDHRGWTADACWDDASWNPTWFVAAGDHDDTWTIEAAIPLDELTGEPPRPKYVWAIGIQRALPGGGLQSWTTPAAAFVMPEGFGYLIFE